MRLNASKNKGEKKTQRRSDESRGEKKTQRRSDESRIIRQYMLRAVKAGDLKVLKSFIGTYQDHPEFHINQADAITGRTLLLEACYCEDIDAVRYLLGVKADANTFDSGGYSVLHRSCERNSVEIARLLIDSKASVRSRTILVHETPLLAACKAGSLPILKLLLEHKANIETASNAGRGPLHCAALYGNLSILKYLVEEAKIDIKAVDESGRGPLHYAAGSGKLSIVKYLVEEAKIDVKAVDEFGVGPLHYAAGSGKLSIVKYLVEEAKIDIKAVDEFAQGPLHHAAGSGYLSTVKYLVEEAKIDIKAVNESGKGPLHYAAGFGKLSTVKYLVEEAKIDIKAVDESGSGPLHYAAGSGDLSTVKYLVEEAKIDVKAMNRYGNTPLEVADDGAVQDYLQAQTALSLFQAVKNESLLDAKALIPQLSLHFIEKEQDEHGNTLPHLACENGDLEMLQLLLDAKASINARRKDGKTSLLIACGRGHVQIVKRLVELKAEMKAGDTNGDGPLHCACYNGHLEVIKFMVDTHHFDFEAHNNQDRTPFDIALSEGKFDTANYFYQKSFQRAVKSLQVEETKAIQSTGQLKLDINHPTDKNGTTSLCLACQNQNLKLSRLLLDSKASIQGHMPDGRTLLLIACSRGHLPAAKALVDNKADVKAVDNKGYGPLHLACLNGHLNMTKFLVENKVDIEAVNEEGKTPLLIASDRGHVQLARCLVELKADVKTADCNGHGPLHLACLKRDLDMVKCLVESCKVNIEAVSKQGKTALSLAREVKQEDDLVSYLEGAIVKDKKITESRLYTFDNGLVRTWLLDTQTKSRIESSVIQMLYDEKVDGQNLLSLARDPKMKEVFPELKSVQWMNIHRFLKPIFESNAPKIPRPTFGRLKMFAREEVNLEDAKELGRGSYGCVFLVKVVGLPGPVVLKRNYYPNISLKSLNAIQKMDKHQNILHIIGMVTLDNDICLISEYCAKGSLFHLSRKNDFEPSDEVLLSYANAIANGLMHLHSKEIVHRDLRADNILVHSDNRVVIGDYGLSRKLPPKGKYYKGVNDQPIPEHWMAPECLRDKKYTFKGDIWSLGVTLYELMTCGRSPYADLDDWNQIRPGVINGSIRLIDKSFGDMFKGKSFPVPSKMIYIAKKCLDFDEKRRPDAGQVLGLVEVARGLRLKYDEDDSDN